ncbi:MAG: tyrosine-type recombinase/integrase [Chloroflexi bacterium]|nr:tyrosine-type recombinase/integrase [Chloroflexota bacterium]
MASPCCPNTLTRAFLKLARLAGITGVRLHDMRHTHASLMLRQGVHPKIVQERLGHATVAITLDLYSHVLPGLQEEAAAAKFEGGLRSASAPVGIA